MQLGRLFFCSAAALLAVISHAASVDLLEEAEIEIEQLPSIGAAAAHSETTTHRLRVQLEFAVFDREEYAGLELQTGRFPFASWRLNDRPLLPPVRGMAYGAMPGLNAALLKDGQNVLEVLGEPSMAEHGRETFEMLLATAHQDRFGIMLKGVLENELTFQRGPVLSDLTPTSVVVFCQVNLRATASLNIAGAVTTSKPGLLHAFHVTSLEPGQSYFYSLAASIADLETSAQIGPFSFGTPLEAGPLRLAIAGYSGAGPNPASRLAAAVLSNNPHAVVLAGPLMPDAQKNDDWDIRFLGPCAALLRAVPARLLVAQNERTSPLLPLVMPGQGSSRNWKQRIGPLQLIGIDESLDWKPGAIHSKWLKQALEESRAPFNVVMILPPAFAGDSSTPQHADNAGATEWEEFLFPLLAECRATALLMPDLRVYDRREFPGGLCMAGNLPAGIGKAIKSSTTTSGNLRAQAYSGDYFIIFDIDESRCLMRAIGFDGKEIDSHAWTPRDF